MLYNLSLENASIDKVASGICLSIFLEYQSVLVGNRITGELQYLQVKKSSIICQLLTIATRLFCCFFFFKNRYFI